MRAERTEQREQVSGRAPATPLGILAAAGPLPIEVAATAMAQGRGVHVVAIEGFAGPEVAGFPHDWVSLGQVEHILGAFRRAGCRELVIAGAMQRPDLLRLRLDLGFFRHLPTVLRLTRGGDDSVLRRVVRFFEGQGFVVRGAGEIAPQLLAPAGDIGRVRADAGHRDATRRASNLVAALAAFDVGQAVVATVDGIVAVEGVRGTDAMLGDLGPGGAGDGLARGGVLVKLAKPGQEMRVDLPTIGPATVSRAQAAGLAGIAVEANGAIVLDRPAVRAAADAAGLFVTGIASAHAAVAADALPPPASIVPLAVISRRAPTPAERRDIALARRLLPVLAREGAGHAAVVAREHVLAVGGRLPVEALIRPLGGRSHWGLRLLKGRIGILALDLAPDRRQGRAVADVLGVALWRAAREAGLAGVVCCGSAVPPEDREAIVGWANEAKLFLMAEAA